MSLVIVSTSAVLGCRRGRGANGAVAKSRVASSTNLKAESSFRNTSTTPRATLEPSDDEGLAVGSHPKAMPVFSALVSSATSLALMFGSAAPAYADTPAETFTKTCAGCHAAGGNVVQSGASLFPSDLDRNGVNDAETIYQLIYSGKNKMPGYGEGCAPRGQCTFGVRLSDDDIKSLASYVMQQSRAGWKD